MAGPVEVVEPSSRDKILDAAEQLFARRGYAGIGLREVADVVGLGKSSLFHHFKNKPQLYAAVSARILVRIEDALMRALAAGGDPVQRFERWVDEFIDMLGAHPAYARVLLRSLFEDDDLAGDLPEEFEARRATQSILASAGALLREGMSNGQIRAAHVPHLLLSLVGLTVFPFATGEFGLEVLGRDPLDPVEVKKRKQEIRDLLRFGLVVRSDR